MSEYIFKLPDLGEGTVEAEIVEWHVAPGDSVVEGQAIVDVMTDKANVEIPSPVTGTVLRTTGEPGDVVAVQSELIAFDTQGVPSKTEISKEKATPKAATIEEPKAPVEETGVPNDAPTPQNDNINSGSPRRIITSPAVRRHAKEAGVSLDKVVGSGLNGRILMQDLETYLQADTGGSEEQRAAPTGSIRADAAKTKDIKVIGIRRAIAEHLAKSKREIPHFAYVEQVDVTELERLRQHLNQQYDKKLSILPFIALALLRSLPEFPQCNAHYEADTGVLHQFGDVHLGIAAQTPDGLKVPVIKNAHRQTLWQLAASIKGLAELARSGHAKPADLSGSTITLTSLGRLGGLVSTPIINHPEVGIVGVNRTADTPQVVNGQVVIRTMMNLSSSFDHRFVDGFDAASFIQAIKQKLEHPATLFIESPPS